MKHKKLFDLSFKDYIGIFKEAAQQLEIPSLANVGIPKKLTTTQLVFKDIDNIKGDVNVIGRSEKYSNIIKNIFKNEYHWTPAGNYILKDGVREITLHPADVKGFNLLKGELSRLSDNTESKTSGKGEIALYWLLSKKYPEIDNISGGENPDLSLMPGGPNVEVKNYSKDFIKLGRYAKQHVGRNILSVILGSNALFNTAHYEIRPAGLDTFNNKELTNAFKTFYIFLDLLKRLEKQINLKELPIINEPLSIMKKADDFMMSLGSNTSLDVDGKSRAGMSFLLRYILEEKLRIKPGFGGFIVDTVDSNKLKVYSVSEDRLKSIRDEDILNGMTLDAGAIKINTNIITEFN